MRKQKGKIKITGQIIFLSLFFSYTISHAQRYFNNDSMLKVYNNPNVHDTDRVQALITLAGNLAQNDPDKSLEYATLGLKEATKIKDKWLIGEANRLLGINCFLKNDFVDAAKYYLEAASWFEKANSKLGESRAYNALGEVYDRQGMLDEAGKCYERALKLREKLSDKWQPTLLGNIGILYARRKNYDQAEYYLNRALAIEKKYSRMGDAAQTMQCLANVALNTKRVDLSKKLMERALFIFDSIDNISAKRNCLIAMSEYYIQTGNYNIAIEYAKRASDLIKGEPMLNEVELIIEVFKEAEMQKGNYKNALFWTDSLIAIKQQLYSTELSGQTKELLEKYKSEKIEKENALLKEEKLLAESQETKRNIIYLSILSLVISISVILFLYQRQKKIRQEQKSTELEQKVLRAQMNPHFIFNALNAIQKLYLEKKQDQADEYMGDFGQLLRKILDNSGKSFISLHEELNSLRLYLNLEKNRLEDKLEFEINGDDMDTHHILVPPLILQPLVENAIWHGIAPKGKGKITIYFSLVEKKLINFIIEDDGVGVGESKNSLHESKGLKLTHERLKPNGWLKIEPGDNGGTIVKIAVPYKIEKI